MGGKSKSVASIEGWTDWYAGVGICCHAPLQMVGLPQERRDSSRWITVSFSQWKHSKDFQEQGDALWRSRGMGLGVKRCTQWLSITSNGPRGGEPTRWDWASELGAAMQRQSSFWLGKSSRIVRTQHNLGLNYVAIIDSNIILPRRLFVQCCDRENTTRVWKIKEPQKKPFE